MTQRGPRLVVSVYSGEDAYDRACRNLAVFRESWRRATADESLDLLGGGEERNLAKPRGSLELSDEGPVARKSSKKVSAEKSHFTAVLDILTFLGSPTSRPPAPRAPPPTVRGENFLVSSRYRLRIPRGETMSSFRADKQLFPTPGIDMSEAERSTASVGSDAAHSIDARSQPIVTSAHKVNTVSLT
ncbi:hypothetical protein KM043_014064 [Ampulex compressa]|nr:hypothetical protein KM043_014064 [Ampulex compressa]